MKTSSLVTSNEWLKIATQRLLTSGIDSASLDALLILCFCLKLPKVEILSNPNRKLTVTTLNRASKLLEKRKLNYPIAYITKKIEFYNRVFNVDSRVLIPRPESESFINLLKTSRLSNLKFLTDVGCGSGILGLTAKLEFPQLDVELLDISKGALKVANINQNELDVQARIRLSNLLDNSDYKFDIILANLPYIPTDMSISASAKFEPKIAIFASTDGLIYYRNLTDQLRRADKKPKYILIECLEEQIESVTKMFDDISYKLVRSESLVHEFCR